MRKLIFALVLCMIVGLSAAPSQAQLNTLNEPGSLLAYPLIDNIQGVTLVNITNWGSVDAILECYMITHGIDGTIDDKQDFVIKLTPKEQFVWMTNQPYNQRGNQIRDFANRKGYLFCFAINNVHEHAEIAYDKLKGDATVLDLGNARAFNYMAIAHQAGTGGPNGDRTLNLDGTEYTMATSQIMFEGLAGLSGSIHGTLAVASPDIDFINSIQPAFDIHLFCWNEVETQFSRHLTFKDFEQYDLTQDLQLDIYSIFTLGWHCATTATKPLWAVFRQDLGTVFGWGGNVHQEPLAGALAVIVLPPLPVQ
jgi:hypothetical protein